ncbi:snake venom vascular endothelial growth factor toxin HF-like isoform X2 [Erythrolamprus reginae]|uniref:snake venom vascular endothelial growth factor toxin HF-like isoform X2 n=1 Tax=Erythrolamprus reginae TaxID=121349 RepID=UPI00396CD435
MARYLLAAAILFCIQGSLPGPEKERPYIHYMQLHRRSSCQPREVLVSVQREHPQEIAHFFRPSCVALQRCRGCCNNDRLKCFAVTKRTVRLQVNGKKLTSQMEGMKFTEHLACECRPQRVDRTKNGKHKRSQVPEEPRATTVPFL